MEPFIYVARAQKSTETASLQQAAKHAHTHVYAYVHMHIYYYDKQYTHTRTHMQMYTHICTHTHTHTQTHTWYDIHIHTYTWLILYNAYRSRWKTFTVATSCWNLQDNFRGCVVHDMIQHMCTYIHMYTHTTYTHIHTYTYIHTYLHNYTQTPHHIDQYVYYILYQKTVPGGSAVGFSEQQQNTFLHLLLRSAIKIIILPIV